MRESCKAVTLMMTQGNYSVFHEAQPHPSDGNKPDAPNKNTAPTARL